MTALSAHEIEILRLTADGLTARQIAKVLDRAVGTIGNTRSRMFCKLGANCAAHAVAVGYRRGILHVEPREAA